MAIHEFLFYVYLNDFNLNHGRSAQTPTIVDATYKNLVEIIQDIQIMQIAIHIAVLAVSLEQDYNKMCNILHNLVIDYGLIPGALEIINKYGMKLNTGGDNGAKITLLINKLIIFYI